MPDSARYPAEIMATAVVPWTEDWQLDERTFRRELEGLMAAGYRHIYTFGTAGEGYAVDDAQFLAITRLRRRRARRGCGADGRADQPLVADDHGAHPGRARVGRP